MATTPSSTTHVNFSRLGGIARAGVKAHAQSGDLFRQELQAAKYAEAQKTEQSAKAKSNLLNIET